MEWEVINGNIITPTKQIANGHLSVKNNKIDKIGRGAGSLSMQVDLNGLLVFPGLIDCHDHLLGTYLPRVGDRKPYMNWLMWDNDLKASPIYAERQQIESADLYLMGGFRHLITGVTTVQDHMPHFVQDIFKQDAPIRIVDNFAMAHSIGSFALKWGEGIEREHDLALEKNIPFITHCSEGFDAETKNSVSVLAEKNALSKQTVLVHGIAFSDADIELLAQNQVNVVWCPVSNLYMFEITARVKELREKGVNVVLGTDSPMSGSVNIFEEFYIAKSYYASHYNEYLPDKDLVDMVTTNAAEAMCLPDLGTLVEGNRADFIVIYGDPIRPYESLIEMSFENIMLVVIDGRPRYADQIFIPVFEALDIDYQKVKVVNNKKIVAGDILGLLDRVRKAVGFKKELAYLPVEPW